MVASLAQPSVRCLLTMLEEVERDLVERRVDSLHPSHVETARAALNRLAELLTRRAAGEGVQLDIAAFVTLAERHLTHIADFLKEINERLKES